MKLRLIAVTVLVMNFLFPNPILAASNGEDGNLSINDQAIYDNGKNNQGHEVDYDVKTIFGPEMEHRNKELKNKDQAVVRKGKKIVFTSSIRSQKSIDHHNQKVIKKYLFKSNYHTAQVVGNFVDEPSWLTTHLYLIVSLIFMLVLIPIGSWLGIKFGKYRAKHRRDENNERRFN